jgi:predicted PhzF superfamily epimerase YddE/YHI9
METNNVIEATKISNSVHAPEYAPVKENEQVLLALGITADHIAALPMIVNTGNTFLLLEARNKEVLQKLQPDMNGLRQLAQQYDLSGYCIFIREKDRVDATALMFGTLPDMAAEASGKLGAGALACYLYDIAMIKKELAVIREGFPVSPQQERTLQIRLILDQGKIQSWQPESGISQAQ